MDVSKSDKKHEVSRWSAINSAISQCDLWENLFWGKNRRGALKRVREKWWKLLWSESESCSAFSSFPLEALEILSAIKGTKRKQLAGAVKVETICSSEEINRMGTEQNEKEGMDLLYDGKSPSVLGWDQGNIAGFRQTGWEKTNLELNFYWNVHFALHWRTGMLDVALWFFTDTSLASACMEQMRM